MRFEEFVVFSNTVRGVLDSEPFQKYLMAHELDSDEAAIQAENFVLENLRMDAAQARRWGETE